MRYILTILFICQTLLNLAYSNNAADSLLSLLNSEKIDTNRSKLFLELGDIYSANNKDTAKYYYGIGGEIAKKSNALRLLGRSYHLTGNVNYIQSEFDKSLDNYIKSLELYKKIDYLEEAGKVISNIGNIYLTKREHRKALKYYLEGVEIAEELNNRSGIVGNYVNREQAHGYLNISKVRLELKEYAQAIYDGERALEIGKKTGILDVERKAYDILSQGYEGLSNYKKAFKYHKLFKLINDSIYNEGKSKQIIELQAEYESKENARENELQRKDNEIQSLVINKQKLIHSFLLVLLMMGVVVIIITFSRTKIKKKADKTLIEKNKLINLQRKELSDTVKQLSEIFEELTVQKEELEAQTITLAEANATKDKFFSIISHDLRGPFNTILGFTNLLQQRFDKYDDTKKKKFLELINDSANSSCELLNNLLVWAKSQSNRIEIRREELNFHDLVNCSIEPYLPFANKKNIDIINKVPHGCILITDKFTMSTVIGNLVNNSIKFTENQGKVIIEANSVNNNCYLEISDTGIGMDQETIDKLFNIDYNFSTRGTQDEPGTGLGLILCKEFIEKNGGNITVESQVGEGSRFICSLPKNSIYSVNP